MKRHSTTSSRYPINPLIVNGVTRSIRSHPYQVHLQTRYWWGGGSSCGGVIVDDYYVLTAAHCLEKSLFGYYYSPSEVKVTFYSSTAPRTAPLVSCAMRPSDTLMEQELLRERYWLSSFKFSTRYVFSFSHTSLRSKYDPQWNVDTPLDGV